MTMRSNQSMSRKHAGADAARPGSGATEPNDTGRDVVGSNSEGPDLLSRDQQGITTAEYAVGTAAGAGLAGLLYKMLTGGFGERLLRTLFDHVLGLLGLG
ncbi:MAG: DUF4244 domain-containing protein [Nocardioides sp.]